MIRHDETKKDYIAQTLQLEMVKQQQLESELNFLKAQYHPHFLFNALNTIYFQVDEENSTAKHTIELLSDLLRYQLYENKQEVAVQQEIDYMESYIQLQKLRMSERLVLEHYFDPQLKEQKIHPLLLQPLLENAFKHIGGDYRINILARWEDGWIKFSVENSVAGVPQDDNERKGIGIENLRRKLELLYPDRHSLFINRNDNHFFVELSIKPSSL
jgi:LytS/YehU family sensor histidine kinase